MNKINVLPFRSYSLLAIHRKIIYSGEETEGHIINMSHILLAQLCSYILVVLC